MEKTAIKIDHVYKEYRLGAIGGGTLRGDLQSWMARIRGKEDPNSKIGTDASMHNGDRFLALDDVSFSVKQGEAVGIIGHNGAGKSTLLKLRSRVTAPTKGTISYNGRIASMLEVGTGFHPELTGRENVYMNGAILGMTKVEIDKKFDQIVEFAKMEEFIDTPVKRYSSGMYVKLAFSVAAHLDSEIMVMDEVLAVGDMKFQQKCLGRMGDAANSEGRTVLYVSHNMNTIRQLCTRCIVLDHGHLIFDGETEKAIEIYMDRSRDLSCKKSYVDYVRPSWLTRDEVRIISAEYVQKGNCTFNKTERIRIKFEVVYQKKVDNLGLRFEILNAVDTPVATSITMLPLNVSDETQTFEIEYSIENLVEGEYKSFYTFFCKNEFGNNRDVDNVPGLQIVVDDNDTRDHIDWKSTHWGNVRLPAGVLLEENDV